MRDAIALFQEIWDHTESKPVGKKEIAVAIERFDARPQVVPRIGETTLLAACRENPAAFKSVYIAAYQSGLSKEAREKFSTFKKQAKPSRNELSEEDFRHAWAYENWDPMKKDDWVIDLDCRNKARPRIHGCAQVTDLRLKVSDEDDLIIALRGVVRLQEGAKPFRISAEEKSAIVRSAAKFLKKEYVPLPEVVKIIDMAHKRLK